MKATPKEKKSLPRRILNIILTVILVLLFLVIALTMFVRISGNTPNFGGYMVFRVSTGSMEPELKVGDVILTKEVSDVASLKVGDIVTYKGAVGSFSDKLITHQVVKAPYKEEGTYYLVTKGIANGEEDPVISENQVVGIMVAKIPFLGAIYSFFLTPWGLIVTILLIILIFAGEFWNIFKLSNTNDDIQEIDEQTLQKAIEKYKADSENNEESADTENDNQ